MTDDSNPEPARPSALIVLAPGAEEIETITMADVLVRANCHVVIAHAEEAVVPGSRGIPLAGHQALDAVLDQPFDCVYLPGGLGSAHYCRDDRRIQHLAQQQLESGRLLAVICACPLALVPRRLAADRTVTSYPTIRDEIEGAVGRWVDQPVVCDGNLITSQGPGTALALALTVAAQLTSETVAKQVAAAMLTPYPLSPATA